ncbi:MAG: hypothetical protein DMD56_07550 [Gemmatimonadetes bacterium]|nr:MAG: hypothetical protein DMD56_07550 [Gemmatimonadota bacterium]
MPGRRQGLAGLRVLRDLADVNDSSRGRAAVGISGSPSSSSKSRMLVEYALARLAARGAVTELVDLATLPADALLGRATAPALIAALETATRAQIIVAGTPVYRATYSGLLKVFFDLLPQDSLIGKVGVPIVTGHGAAHSLSVDHGMRPLFASLGATVVATRSRAVVTFATTEARLIRHPARYASNTASSTPTIDSPTT